MGAALDRDTIEKAYARWAPVYDVVFGARVRAGPAGDDRGGRRTLGPQGGRILEVGVGTGLSLLDYNRTTAWSASTSLRRCCAGRRIASSSIGLTNVEALAVMDAKHLALPDVSFDVVVAQYVITAVPDPEATLDEFVRVLKPGGEIILVNHLAPSAAFAASSSRAFADRAPARLEPGVSLGAADAWAERGRRPPDRAPADAAARAFLADSLRQAGGCTPHRWNLSARPVVEFQHENDHSGVARRAAAFRRRGCGCGAGSPSMVIPKVARRASGCRPTARRRKENGEPLSDKLARTDGVICPPNVDPEIKAPTPQSGGKMPVIPPPGSPGGDPSIQPK